MDETDYLNRIKQIDWKIFDTAYGKATDIPNQLTRLAGSIRKDTMSASHDLWCGLCHQHAYISSVALPALPFILEVLDNADEELTVEILDILLGFSLCTSSKYYENCIGDIQEWEIDLRKTLKTEINRFHLLKNSENKEIKDFASGIIDCLEK